MSAIIIIAYFKRRFNYKKGVLMDIVELGVGISAIAGGAFLLAYIKKIKNKLKKFVLRDGGKGG